MFIDIIEEAIQKQSILRDNARIIANLMEFNEEVISNILPESDISNIM